MADSLVTTAFDAGTGVARLTFNRPKALNAINVPLAEAFLAAVREIRDLSGVRCIVLTGAGRAFMAGGDVSRMAGTSEQAGAAISAILDAVNPAVLLLRGMDAPVIAAVRGVAAGAGANLALACDIVLAARSAKFVQAFGKVGLIPDSGGTWLLPRLVGIARARALVMLAEPVTAETAESWGMIWRAVPDETLMAEAEATVAKLVALSPQALALSKQALAASPGNGLAQQLALEAQLQGEAGRSEDYREGVEAFLEKRAPRFGKRP